MRRNHRRSACKRAYHAKGGQRDAMRRDFRQRGQNNTGVDPFQGANQVGDRKNDDDETAAIPSRFQPIFSLKPRPSAVSSRCIHPPGRGQYVKMGPVTKDDSRRSEAPCAKSISQNGAVVQPLTSMPFGVVRHPCHTPYICRRVNDFESQRGSFHVHFLPFGLFHRGVFEAFRNILFASRLPPYQHRT